MLAREPASFWREKGSRRPFYYGCFSGRKCHSGGNKLSSVKSFIILGSEEGLTSFDKNNRVNFCGKKKRKIKISGVPTF